MQVIRMGFKYKSRVRVRLDYCNVYICACFYGSGFDIPGFDMEPIILVNMIITVTFHYICCIKQSSLNLSY